MEMKIITPEVVVAYSQCRRKAFLLLCSEDQGVPHEYVRLLEQQARLNRIKYRTLVEQEHPGVSAGNADLLSGEDVLLEVPLRFHDLAADCDVLTKVNRGSSLSTSAQGALLM